MKPDLSRLLDKNYLEAELARRSLKEFTKQAWPVVEPGTEYVPNWHLDAINDHLTAVTQGHIRNLLINIPPRHSKSLSVSVFWPMWTWTFNPYFRWIFASYALTLAIGDSLKCRRLVMSDWYQEHYGNVFQMSKDNNLKSRFDNNKRGARLAVSVNSAVTGMGADILVCDDPHNVIDAESQAMRENALVWWDTAMSSRLNNPKTGAKVIVMQRVHEADLAGHVLEQGGYVHLNLPMEYEADRKCITSFAGKTWSDPRTTEGELLWKERFNRESVEGLKRSLGSYAYGGQYQQRPSPASGGVFQRQWLRYYVDHGDYYEVERANGNTRIPLSECRRIITVDLAISEKESADYTVMEVWDISKDNDIILIDMYRERIDNPTQQKQIKLFYQRYRPMYVMIESVAYQLALVQQLRADAVPVREYIPPRNKDKVARATTAAVLMEGEKVFLPKKSMWLVDYEQELLMFPKGAHDDVVDPTSMIAEEVSNKPTPSVRQFGRR